MAHAPLQLHNFYKWNVSIAHFSLPKLPGIRKYLFFADTFKNMSHTRKLNNGLEIPVVGLGTYKSEKGELKQAVKDAMDAGYRHFDCAWYYENEEEIGEALAEKLQEGTVKRSDLFITSKLWNNFHAKDSVVPKLKETLQLLKLDYLDLYLMHWPFGFKEDAPFLPTEGDPKYYSDVDYVETWNALEECVQLGLAKSIGVSNFNSEQIDRVLASCKIKPVVNQIEVNPKITQKKLIQFCKDRQIVVVAFTPLGRSSYMDRPNFPKPSIFDPRIIEISKKYNKTSAQVILNYLVFGLGVVVIPKSVTKSRIVENINIFDFKLSPDEITSIDSCHTGERVSAAATFKNHKYYPFNIEF